MFSKEKQCVQVLQKWKKNLESLCYEIVFKSDIIQLGLNVMPLETITSLISSTNNNT
jgi:hypothetical protein